MLELATMARSIHNMKLFQAPHGGIHGLKDGGKQFFTKSIIICIDDTYNWSYTILYSSLFNACFVIQQQIGYSESIAPRSSSDSDYIIECCAVIIRWGTSSLGRALA